MSVDTTPHEEALRSALAAALRRVYGQAAINDDLVDSYRSLGFTAQVVEDISALATFASGYAHAVSVDDNGKVIYHQGVFRRLLDFAFRLNRGLSMPVTETLPWLAVVAGTPAERAVRLRPVAPPSATLPLKRDMERGPDGHWVTDSAGSVLAAWRTAVPPEIAALGWMAGLTPAEAQTGHRSGAYTADGLQLLATLRGYRIAPLLRENHENRDRPPLDRPDPPAPTGS